MKKFTFISTLILVVFLATSCQEEETITNGKSETSTGTYELYMEGNLVKQGTSTEIGMIKDSDGNYTANASIAEGEDISLLATGFSLTIGESVSMINGGPQITIQGKNLLLSDDSEEMYFATSGTLTRISGSKISFEGICEKLHVADNTPYSFSGFIESEAFTNIK